MQDVGQSEALAKQSVKCKKRAFSCEKYGLENQPGLSPSPARKKPQGDRPKKRKLFSA